MAESRIFTNRKTYGYIRIFKDTDVPVDEQRRKIEALAEWRGLGVVNDILVDRAPLWPPTELPALERLKRLIAADDVAAVVAISIKHLGENRTQWRDLFGLCLEHGTSLLVRGVNDDAVLSAGMLGLIAAQMPMEALNAEATSKGTASALKRKREAGEAYSKTPPYGYKREALQLVPEDSEWPWLEMMKQLRLEGQTFDAIAAALNEAGSRPRSGKPWTRQLVRKIMNSRMAREP